MRGLGARAPPPPSDSDVVVLFSDDGDEEASAPAPPSRRRRGTEAKRRRLPSPEVVDLTRDDDDGDVVTGSGGARGGVARPRCGRGGAAPVLAPFACAVCLSDDVAPAAGRRLFCGHVFCADCLGGLVASAVAAGLADGGEGLRCPTLSCLEPLSGADVDRCAPDAATAARFHALAFERYVARSAGDGMGCCPTPGCTFAFVWDETNRKLACPLCAKQYCLVCKCDWHAGQRCEARAAALAAAGGAGGEGEDGLAALARKGKWKLCPRCGAWIERESGCDAMKCRCGQKFCFQCGRKTGAGPDGRGECICTAASTAHVHAYHADANEGLGTAVAAAAAAGLQAVAGAGFLAARMAMRAGVNAAGGALGPLVGLVPPRFAGGRGAGSLVAAADAEDGSTKQEVTVQSSRQRRTCERRV